MATPIGNLRDVTLRALDVLRCVDIVAAEDTRVTARLLDAHGIASKKLVALHEHNENRAAPGLIAQLAAGRSIALTSDAGTPAFSDPGARLVAAVRAAGFRVVPVPGPNAAAAALSVSGLPATPFVFCGFLPAKAGERGRAIQALASLPYALVFYEAPHRVSETIVALASGLGGARSVVIARELTKMFESVHTCTLEEAGAWLAADANRIKGEFVLIVQGAQLDVDTARAQRERALAILLEELPVKQAAALAARLTGGRKKELYARALELKRGNA